MVFRPITFSLLCIFTHTALANEISGNQQIQQQQNILEQQRQQQLNQQMQPDNHVQLPVPQPINSLSHRQQKHLLTMAFVFQFMKLNW